MDAAGGMPNSSHQEPPVTNPAIRLATLAMFSMALAAAPPLVPAFAAGGGGGGRDPPTLTSPPQDSRQTTPRGTRTTHKAQQKEKRFTFHDPALSPGYR